MATNYIPASDSGFNTWANNFSALITAAPADYGLTAPDATAISTPVNAYMAAYALVIDPGTRTPTAIADKDAKKAAALAVVRPYAMQINARAATTDEQRSELGITIRKLVPTPVPAPVTAPILGLVSAIPLQALLTYQDPETPTSKAKPFGVTGVQLFVGVGTTPAIDPAQCSFSRIVTKSPFRVSFAPADAGKVATVFARYQTRSGVGGVSAVGPWSASLTFNVLA